MRSGHPAYLNYTRGFSYAELLSVMMILGSIATFTLPKIFYASSNAQKNAIIREATASINGIVEQGRLTGELNVSNFGTYMTGHINALKVCPNDAYAEGCWDMAHQGAVPDEGGQPGFILHNGATLMGADDYCCELSIDEWCNGMILDWNGTKGPNMIGEDQIKLEVNYGFTDGKTDWCEDNRRGTVNVEKSMAGSVWGF